MPCVKVTRCAVNAQVENETTACLGKAIETLGSLPVAWCRKSWSGTKWQKGSNHRWDIEEVAQHKKKPLHVPAFTGCCDLLARISCRP